jgi:ABC-type Mn2+/Zn2+ transport system ATPase subunit
VATTPFAEAAGAPAAVVGERVDLSRGRHPVLSTATFVVPAGAVTSLVGPNGAGKSSLLDAVVGLLPLNGGRLQVLGGPPEAARRRVAYVLQAAKVNDQLPITVRETVTMGRFAERGTFGRLRPTDRQAVEEAIERLELTDLVHRHLHELSGGQRQRVFVAQGLAQQAEVLLLDEPVTGLDVVSRQRILEVVEGERAAGRTVVMTTHDLSDAASTDHVLLLSGRVVAEGPPAAVLTATHLADAYGGRILRLPDGDLLIDDPHHHHADGRDHTVCAEDDELG